jgi:hypothetical protein
MFSTIGTLVADSITSFTLLTPVEVAAASTILAVTLSGLVVLGWLTNERDVTSSRRTGPRPTFKKAA